MHGIINIKKRKEKKKKEKKRKEKKSSGFAYGSTDCALTGTFFRPTEKNDTLRIVSVLELEINI